MSDDYPEVSQWQLSTTWFYFPCFRGYRTYVERLESAIHDADNLHYAIYQYVPFLSPHSWGILIYIHHAVDSGLPTILAIARGELVRLLVIARRIEEEGARSTREQSCLPSSR
ncbi:hypothetical protein BO94DRAFT_541503 [Aspergillus sclerotioniger CBS 115572]|uniref:Uncharacterized protein n=1 Tax=Aspergillus sclerotioniger CBS 115572 TaxID=1450535 RepID=A0A317XFS1_9EURO|nr:hypothetical protein BO94DRAFT_541503 [Aspergillus sclerotioniger CBS 115572]PWY96712.1 hypothetical protein BO94DRAFT_541503 [Aspergillus sclerotioniger CBS 115572]